MKSFIEDCIQGHALLEDIDDYVDQWHESPSEFPLSTFLGMTPSEYSLWVADPDVLPFIVTAHREQRDVSNIIEQTYAIPLAARSGGLAKTTELIAWLKSQGLWQ